MVNVCYSCMRNGKIEGSYEEAPDKQMLDQKRLIELIEAKMALLGISDREAARRADVPHTTFRNLRAGKWVTYSTLDKLASWLEIDAKDLLTDENTDKEEKIAASLATILKTNPELAQVFEDALARLARGEIAPETLEDIVSYTTWRLNAATKNRRGEEGRTNSG